MIDFKEVTSAMSEVTGYDIDVLTGPDRSIPLPFIRFCLWKVMYESGWHTEQIGRMFGRDHSTVVCGIKRARERIGHASYESDTDIYNRFKLRIMSENDLFLEVVSFMRKQYQGLDIDGTKLYYKGVCFLNFEGNTLLYNLTRLCERLESELV